MSARTRIATLVEGKRAQAFITALIVLNAVTLGLETSPAIRAAYGQPLAVFDAFVLTVFVLEIAAKLYGRGRAFFRDPWNVFDFLVVGIALVPTSGPFSVLRALRILRIMRLVSVVPQMRRVTQALVLAIPGMAPIIGLIAIIFYVAAVIATSFFGSTFAPWFGSVGESMYTLFQIMTLESWSMGIVRPVMDEYPYAWAFFVPFIVITSFAVINLFIGVIVDAMQTQHEQEAAEVEEHVHADAATLRDEIALLRGEVTALREALSSPSGGALRGGSPN
ncbi:MAG: ion transporter [Gammaproteobacteria bacterium]|nr:ion transporter [Gammaproteobacteria bacterium]